MEDYSNFSWEAIQASFREIYEEIQRDTGATDEEMFHALEDVSQRFMDTNMFELGNRRAQ